MAPAGVVFLLYLVFVLVFLVPLAPAFVDNWRRGIGPAFICACIGFLVGAVWPWGYDNTYLTSTDPGYVRFAAGLLFGSVGWIAGATIGWFHPRFEIERSQRPARRLGWRSRSSRCSGSCRARVHDAGIPRSLWVSMFAAGEAIVAVTLFVLAQRNRFRQVGAVVGAIVALTIVTRIAIGFSSTLPADRAWLDIWRSAQPDAASFTPNLLTPASPVCPGVAPAGGLDPGFRYPDSHSSTWLDGHVPRWLPDGFGILTWSDMGPSVGEWADGGCGLVRLVLEDHEWTPEPRLRARDDVDQIGRWFVWERHCPRSLVRDGPCLVYRSGFQEETGESGSLLVWTWGIDRDVGDEIALGIAVGSPTPYPRRDARDSSTTA